MQTLPIFIDNYETLVKKWITSVNSCFLLTFSENFTLVLNRFRYLHFNYFKMKTYFNGAKENKRGLKANCYETC